MVFEYLDKRMINCMTTKVNNDIHTFEIYMASIKSENQRSDWPINE